MAPHNSAPHSIWTRESIAHGHLFAFAIRGDCDVDVIQACLPSQVTIVEVCLVVATTKWTVVGGTIQRADTGRTVFVIDGTHSVRLTGDSDAYRTFICTMSVVADREVAIGSACLLSKRTAARVCSVVATTDWVVVFVTVCITDARSVVVLVHCTVSAPWTPYTLAWRTYGIKSRSWWIGVRWHEVHR